MQTAGNLKPISERPADGYLSTQSRHASFVPRIPSIRSEWEDKPKISQRMIHSSSICTAEVWKLVITEHMTWKQSGQCSPTAKETGHKLYINTVWLDLSSRAFLGSEQLSHNLRV